MAQEDPMANTSRQSSAERPVSSIAVGFTAFAAVVMIMTGAFQAFQGLVAVLNDEFFVAGQKWTLSLDLTTWGWVHLIIGALVAVAGGFVLKGAVWARAIGVTVATVSALLNFMWLPYYPIWSVLIIALDVIVIWALIAHGRDIARRP
jgi:hypothetical protein